MILPRILIIDDQYARDDDERNILKHNAGIVETSHSKLTQPSEENLTNDIVAAALFCSGQRENIDQIVNDYAVIRDEVAKGWGEGSKFQWNLVLLDVRFDSGKIKKGGKPSGKPDDDRFGELVRDRLNVEFPGLPLVMFSSKGEIDIESSKTPYLSKEDLKKRELKECLLNHGILNVDQARHLLELEDDVIVTSPAMIAVYRQAYSYAATDNSVLILGDSGVGKERIAQYIHRMSSVHNGPFIPINVAAIPDTLLESELFGVIPNFPGFHNTQPQVGKFELANNGTLFLDEIGDMSPLSQAKILRALQERQIYRLGGNQPIRLNIRVLSATARDISQKINNGEFLNDLLHRIGTLPIVVPPLSKHPEDIIPLAESFLAKSSRQQNKRGISLSEDAKKQLINYPFANNNVRELENLIKLLISTTGNNRVIFGKDVDSALLRSS